MQVIVFNEFLIEAGSIHRASTSSYSVGSLGLRIGHAVFQPAPAWNDSFEDHTFAIPQTEDGLEVLQTLMGPLLIKFNRRNRVTKP